MAESTDQYPTQGSFTLNVGIMYALKQEAERRGVSISALVREILADALMAKAQVA